MTEIDWWLYLALRDPAEQASWETDLRKLLRLWLRVMPEKQLARMDHGIVSQVGIAEDVPVDTALITMRDMINKFLGNDVHIEAVIRNGELAQISTAVDDDRLQAWIAAFYSILNKETFRLCQQCGKPFAYKSDKAMFCGNACRIKASRARTA